MYKAKLAKYAVTRGLGQPYISTKVAGALLFDEIQEAATRKRAVERSIERNIQKKEKKESLEQARKRKAQEKAIIQRLTQTDWFEGLVRSYFRDAARFGIKHERVQKQANLMQAYLTHPNSRIRKLSFQQGKKIEAELAQVSK